MTSTLDTSERALELRGSNDVELLAHVLLGSLQRRRRLAHRLLHCSAGVFGLRQLSVDELRELGLSHCEVRRLLAAFELGRRVLVKAPLRRAIAHPEHAYACVAEELLGQPRECFVVVSLDIRNRPLRVERIAEGCVDACPVDLREVFGTALRQRASGIIVAHNHPSGDPEPSTQDIVLTQRLARAGELLGLPVLDHIIVGQLDGSPPFVSMAQRAHLPRASAA